MRYFTLNSNHFEKWVSFPNEKDHAFLNELDVTSSKDFIRQSILEIDWIEEGEEDGKERKWLDTHTSSPVFSVISLKAEKCLNKFLEPNGFLISTKGLNDNYLIYNVTTVLKDALDWDKSKINGDRNHLSEIKKAAVYKDKIQDVHVFKLSESRVEVFVSESFKNVVENCNLTGFIFTEIILT